MGFFWKNGIGLEGTQPIFGGGFWLMGFGVVGFGCWVWEFLAVSCSRLNRGIFSVDCCEVVGFC